MNRVGRRKRRQPRVTRSEILRRHQHPEKILRAPAVSVEVGPRGDQPGESRQDRDYGLTSESTSTRNGRQQYMGMPKMIPPILKDRGRFPEFREQVIVYANSTVATKISRQIRTLTSGQMVERPYCAKGYPRQSMKGG